MMDGWMNERWHGTLVYDNSLSSFLTGWFA